MNILGCDTEIKRKRLKSITITNTASGLAEENSSFWNPLRNLTKNKDEASVSETKLFQTTLVAEMGMGMLDSEDSSSSVASGNVLAVSVSADENSNDNTLNLDASFCRHRRNHRSTDISLDKSNDNVSKASFSNETSDAKYSHVSVDSVHCTCNNHAIDAFSDDSKQLTQHLVNSDKQIIPQYKKNAILGAGVGIIPTVVTNTKSNTKLPTGSGITYKSTRSPLATVTCNNFAGSGSKFQQIFKGGNSSNGIVNNTNSHLIADSITSQNIARALSPSMPSTSQQAALFKHQQQLRNLESQKQQDQLQTKLPPPRFVPDENFFLYRNQLTRSQNFVARDNFTTLSDEIILQIFKWLPKKALMRCSCVCRRFNRCAKDESLWTRLDLGGRSLRSGALEFVLTRGVVILRLAQTEFNHPVFEARFFQNEPEFVTKLQYLDLSMIYITKASLKMLLSRCRELKKLSLEHVPLNDEICYEIAKNVNLEALNMAMCLGLEAWSVRKIMESLNNLNSLNISWTNLTVDAVTSLVTNITPNIMRINIAGCRTTMFDSHLSNLAKRCPQLLELDLSDCTGLTSNAIGIVCKFKMLEYLSLSRCYQIPASSYMDLSNLRTLTYLDVFGILSDTALEMLERNFPSLGINKFIHSSVARPTVGTRRTSIWGLRTRD